MFKWLREGQCPRYMPVCPTLGIAMPALRWLPSACPAAFLMLGTISAAHAFEFRSFLPSALSPDALVPSRPPNFSHCPRPCNTDHFTDHFVFNCCHQRACILAGVAMKDFGLQKWQRLFMKQEQGGLAILQNRRQWMFSGRNGRGQQACLVLVADARGLPASLAPVQAKSTLTCLASFTGRSSLGSPCALSCRPPASHASGPLCTTWGRRRLCLWVGWRVGVGI